jgi:DNA-binding IclR family transcriptional regulator
MSPTRIRAAQILSAAGKTSTIVATPPPASDRETGTIARTVLVLRAIAQAREEPTMKELADTVNLPISTMHRLLDLLMREGMVDRNDTTRAFRPGFEFFRLGSLVVHRMPLKAVARPFLVGAAREAGESSYFGLLDERSLKLVFINHAESGQMLDYRVPLNVPYALSTGSSGQAALAWLAPAVVERVIAAEDPDGRRDPADTRRALVQIREHGFANTHSQRIQGAVGFFSPVFDAGERVCGTFGYTMPESRYKKKDRERLGGLAMKYAGDLSRTIGYPGAWPRPAKNYDFQGHNPSMKADDT